MASVTNSKSFFIRESDEKELMPMQHQGLVNDLMGIVGEYLLKNNAYSSLNLHDQVEALLQTAEMCEVFGNSVTDAFTDIEKTQKNPVFIQAKRIAEFALAAGKGEKKRVSKMLKNNKALHSFDLSNQQYPWSQPRYLAFSYGTKLAAMHGQEDMLHFLLGHPKYQDMITTNRSMENFPRDRYSARAKRVAENNHIVTYTKAVDQTIIQETAKTCILSNQPNLLQAMYDIDYSRPKFALQEISYELDKLAKKSGVKKLEKIVSKNIDTSEPAHW